MMHTLTSPLGCWAVGEFASAARGGAWAVGGAPSGGKRKPVRYAAVRVGADADKQSVGNRGEFTRGVQHFTQPDGLRAARSSLRLVLRWAPL